MENDIHLTELGLIFVTGCMGIYVCVIPVECRLVYYEFKGIWNSST
jgi:hypothetical protein